MNGSLEKSSPEFNKMVIKSQLPKPMGYKFIAVNAYFKKAEDQTVEVAQPLTAKTYNQKDKTSRSRPLAPQGSEGTL